MDLIFGSLWKTIYCVYSIYTSTLTHILTIFTNSIIYNRKNVVKGKDLMKGNLFQRCTHLLYCSVLSLGRKVSTRRMSKPEMGSIFHIKKSMKYSGHRKLLCELSKFSKFNAFNLLGYLTNTDASILVYKFRPKRTGFNMYAEYTRLQ